MKYVSTRIGPADETSGGVGSARAIWQGMSKGGGLFVPGEFPRITLSDLKRLAGLPYHERAAWVLKPFLTDYSPDEIDRYVKAAYAPAKFGGGCAPVRKLDDSTFCLELWHGPTCAFKDMALQLLPHLLTGAMDKTGTGQEAVILVATSGDTGKAALEGFAGVPGVRVVVFYPEDGVSPVQKAQMVTQEGDNVHVVAVKGNFDDTQTGVKLIFGDKAMGERLAASGLHFSSANSINWGRLAPQIVYYISAYADLMAGGHIEPGEKVNFTVPTGNFGDILAAYYSMKMGLPVGKLICASNENNVLTEFFETGLYNRMRAFKKTTSPAMDILISSNLERLLFEISGRNRDMVTAWMADLSAKGSYRLTGDALSSDSFECFWAGCSTEAETAESIRRTWRKYGYLIDTHTAVGFDVLDKYRSATGDGAKTVVVSTASPYKFNFDVAMAVMGEGAVREKDEFTLLDELSAYSGVPIPPGLKGLKDKPVRHGLTCGRDGMKAMVEGLLGL